MKILMSKIYKRMTDNDAKSYPCYLKKFVDEYKNTYHHSFDKNPTDADSSDSSEETESDRVMITKYKNIFRIFYRKNGLEKYL